VKGFGQGILSNIFHKSDFVTNFATTGMMFILSPSSVDCFVYIRKRSKNKMKDNPKVNAKKPVRHGKVDSHAGSDDTKIAAHSMQNTAKMTAKKGKNETQAPTRSLSKKAGTESHKIVYDAKTGGHSAEPDNAMADAHNPHKHAGIASYKLSHDSKTGSHKAVSAGAKGSASKTLKITGVKAKKESGSKKTGTHKTVKSGFVANIEEETRKNKDFRRVLYTGENCQFVLMSLKPLEDIGMETHDTVDQFFRFEEGNGSVVINGKKHAVKDGGGVIVPCGAAHNVINTSKTAALKLYTIYSPPNHLDKVVRKTKQEALAKEEHFDGKTTE
jgi:mannose-6-phosphate isomerase-like protein (cupin superfamily)